MSAGLNGTAGQTGEPDENREKNRGVSDSDPKIVEFCPKSANILQRQGINREFCGYLPKLLSTKWLVTILVGFKKLTGN